MRSLVDSSNTVCITQFYFNHVSIVFVTHHNDHGVDGEGIVDDAADGVLEAEALDPVNPAQISPQTIDGEILSSESCDE